MNKILFVSIGPVQQHKKLTTRGEEAAKIKRNMIKEAIAESKKVAVIFNFKSTPSVRAAKLMTSDLSKIELCGVACDTLSEVCTLNPKEIIDLIDSKQKYDIVIVVATNPVCFLMPNHYLRHKNLKTFNMVEVKDTDMLSLDLKEGTLDVVEVEHVPPAAQVAEEQLEEQTAVVA